MNAEAGDRSATESTAHMQVSCSLTLPPELIDAGVDAPLTVRLSIQDVTMLDEASTTVAEAAVLTHGARELTGRFELEADLQPGRQYAIRARGIL